MGTTSPELTPSSDAEETGGPGWTAEMWHQPKELARLAGNFGPDALVVIDPTGSVCFTGRSIERVLGFDRTTDLGRPMYDFVHPDDLMTAMGALNEARRSTGYQHPTEFRVRHAHGHWVDCEVNGNGVDGPGGLWVILSIRLVKDRDEVIARRRKIEQLIRMASLECSAVSWDQVDDLVERFLHDLAEVVGAELVELAWEETEGDLRIGARWPTVRTGPYVNGEWEHFTPLWPLAESAAALLRFSADLGELEPSPLRDRFMRLNTRAVVEVPLSARAPWVVLRLAFGESWRQWDDANVDLITVLVTTLMATLRRCQAEAHLHVQARTDPLTGLVNRAELYRCFQALLSGRDHGGHRAGDDAEIGVLYGDLDGFKEVNDRYGHAAGDQLLIDVAEALRGSVRQVDMVARVGGDEFVVVCPELDSPDTLVRIMGRISRAVGAIDARGLPVRISLGAALAAPGLRADDVVRLADEAMYRAKRARGTLREQS